MTRERAGDAVDVRQRRSHGSRPPRCLAALTVVLASGALANPLAAQDRVAPTGLRVEEIRSGLMVAPDVRLTGIDGGHGTLVGAYGGLVTDRRLLLGAGAYWLTGASGSVEMAYGGGLVEWFANPRGLVDVSFRGFVGLGAAALGTGRGPWGRDAFPFVRHGATAGHFSGGNATTGSRGGNATTGSRHGAVSGHQGVSIGRSGRRDLRGWLPWDRDRLGARFHEEFVIAEPQVSVYLNLKPWLRLGGGAGYRFIGQAGGLTDRLQGPTASFGVQFGPP